MLQFFVQSSLVAREYDTFVAQLETVPKLADALGLTWISDSKTIRPIIVHLTNIQPEAQLF